MISENRMMTSNRSIRVNRINLMGDRQRRGGSAGERRAAPRRRRNGAAKPPGPTRG